MCCGNTSCSSGDKADNEKRLNDTRRDKHNAIIAFYTGKQKL